jgi:hypothetical protein
MPFMAERARVDPEHNVPATELLIASGLGPTLVVADFACALAVPDLGRVILAVNLHFHSSSRLMLLAPAVWRLLKIASSAILFLSWYGVVITGANCWPWTEMA